jgi:SAM-dependent methyltransferase
MPELPDHVERNRSAWDGWANEYVDEGRRNWESEEPIWGLFAVPESEVGLLPKELEGRDAMELGCGTGYVSAWLARHGARPVGIDNSEAQLANARAFQKELGIDFPLHHGDAERTPFPDASFDLAISEYGASIWCDPLRLDPRGGAAAATRRRARLPRQLDARGPLRPRRHQRARRRSAPPPALRYAPDRMGRRPVGRIPPAAGEDDRAAARL